jgi:hypothetical protein
MSLPITTCIQADEASEHATIKVIFQIRDDMLLRRNVVVLETSCRYRHYLDIAAIHEK